MTHIVSIFLCVLALFPLAGMAGECGESRKLLAPGPLDLLAYAHQEELPENVIQALEPRIGVLNQ